MLLKFLFLILSCNILFATQAQNYETTLLNIGSPAPLLKVREWIKGKPIEEFEKGKVYVVDFWATWCGPCIEEMPRLSALANKYKGKVTFIGMNVYERKNQLLLNTFIDSMSHWMDYSVATQDSNYMELTWMDGIGESTIPKCFVVDAAGRLAWIGYPTELENVLPKILGNNWDLKGAMAERNINNRLKKIGREAFATLNKYNSNAYIKDFFGEPDSALLLINALVRNEPELKFERSIVSGTLHALLRISPHKAYEYGRMVMSLKNPSYDAIIVSIKDYPYQYNTLPKEIFELGAEACQAEIDQYPWTTRTAENYFRMADWYLRANNKLKAKQAMRKAIKALKTKKRLIFERLI